MKPELIKAIAVTAELTGTEMSPAAAKVFSEDLARYPLNQVLAALTRCRREVKGRLVLADVLSRIDDGFPDPEEAWAMLPKREDDSVIWCQEMATAFGVCNPLLQDGDTVAARMAFKEAYTKAVQRARDAGVQPKWIKSYGTDKDGRARAIREAADRGRLTNEGALAMLSELGYEYAEQHRRALEGPRSMGELLAHVLPDNAA